MLNEITMSADNFNEIMGIAKKYVDPKCARLSATQVHIRVENNIVYATSFNGIRLCTLGFPTVDKEPDGNMVIPVCNKVPKNAMFCKINVTDKEVTITTALGKTSMVKEQNAEFANPEKFLPTEEPKEVFYFDPKNLADALTPFKETVKIEYHGELKGFVIKDANKKALVLPVHPPRKEGWLD